MTCCFPSIGTIAGEVCDKTPGSPLWSMCKGVILYRFRYIDQLVPKNILNSCQMCIHMTYLPSANSPGRSGWLFRGQKEHQNDQNHIHWFIHLRILTNVGPSHLCHTWSWYRQVTLLYLSVAFPSWRHWRDLTKRWRNFQKPLDFDFAECDERATCQQRTYWLLMI